jgi:hypothetical protein
MAMSFEFLGHAARKLYGTHIAMFAGNPLQYLVAFDIMPQHRIDTAGSMPVPYSDPSGKSAL